MEEQNVAIRLKGFIDSLGISYSQFADQCGMPRPTLSQLLNGRNKKISDVLVGQIHKAYPELSVLWLMFGEGPMLQDSHRSSFKNSSAADSGIGNESENAPDGTEIATEVSQNPEYENLKALNMATEGYENLVNKIVEYESKISELHLQIENLTKNPRRVTQIIVYYDDSTFEAFLPYSDFRKSESGK